jgi:hypothetical protein
MNMKVFKIVLSVLLCFSIHKAQSESLMILNEGKPIKIYADSTKMDCIAVIKDSKENEQWSQLTMHDESTNRFLVSIANEPTIIHLYGWIDKTDCSVALWQRKSVSTSTSEEIEYKLYSSPTKQSPCQLISEKRLQSIHVRILDYEKGWFKVQCLLISGKKIVGWTDEYCGLVYGCEGL